MASPYQQQALRRKLIYLGLIVALFTIAGTFRAYVVEARADELSIREQNLGEVEVGSSALQLSLTGSRGFVVCGLWYWAMDAQKKNRWNELELYVDSLTRLQPHFISPWLFQSWNLAYNVSVEADQVKDKYFYVTRGVQLLGKGERKNHFNPDLRFNMGFYQQHKVMQSDETNYMRCLYQLSCIPPPQRDPERFLTGPEGKKTLDLAAFEEFCIAHPQLVRRLHDRLRCNKPEEVVHFLAENQRIPSIYVDDPEEAGPEWRQGRYPLKPMPDRFPALPPPADIRRSELPRPTEQFELYDVSELSYESALDDSFDAHAGARAWYGYAQDAIPEPSEDEPGESLPITDPTRQRKPKMTTNIFRNHPCRAQSYIGERLADEGWFGTEGWLIPTGWFPKDLFHDGRPAIVGTTTSWAEQAWTEAHRLWKRRGERSGMLRDDQFLAEMNARAIAYQESHKQQMGGDAFGTEPPADSPDHDGWKAAKFMFHYNYANSLPNFRHFYYSSLVEKDPLMIEARRTMFQARQNVRQGHRDDAAELFESGTGLQRLRLILEMYPHSREDPNTQEEFYELQVRYVKLMQDKERPLYMKLMGAGHLLGTGVPHGAAGTVWPGAVNLMLTGPSLMSNLPDPEFVPGTSNLMQDKAQREKYQRLVALGNLVATPASGGPAPLVTGSFYLSPFQVPPPASDLLAPAFVPGGLMRIDAPGQDGKPLINEMTVMQVMARHGLLKITPPMMPPGGGMPPGSPPPPGMMPGRGGGPPGAGGPQPPR